MAGILLTDEEIKALHDRYPTQDNQETQKILSPIESLQNAHQKTREAINPDLRSRELKTYQEEENADSRTILHALKSIINRLDRIELLLRATP